MSFREKLLSLEALPAWRAELRRAGRRLVVTNGCFDLLHIGHATYLEAARDLGDALLVGVNGDASVRALKGPSRPVNAAEDRSLLVAALASVDAVCVFAEASATEFLRLARPDVWAKGGDYTLDTLNQTERQAVETACGRIAFIPFVPGKSTTALLRRFGGG
ncbi:MAG: adenylyltransferase/cytidyltransferase family protein [Limisphaerales bacterium]